MAFFKKEIGNRKLAFGGIQKISHLLQRKPRSRRPKRTLLMLNHEIEKAEENPNLIGKKNY